VRVVIAEDEALMRTGLELVLEKGGLEVVGEAVDAAELLELTDRCLPDVVITDIRMPPTRTDEGLRAALSIRRAHPGVGVLVLSQHVQRKYAVQLVGARTGGVGYLLKQRIADVEEFSRDVRRVGDGGTVLDPEVVAMLVARSRRDRHALDRLTARQIEVLGLMAQGRSNAAIARQLDISDKAVVFHVSHIYDQLDLPASDDDHRRVLAVVRYLTG
jgi:DNA-binding NarL/FixJ family response regulator